MLQYSWRLDLGGLESAGFHTFIHEVSSLLLVAMRS